MEASQVFVILASICLSYLCGVYAYKKDRHPIRWFIISAFLLTPPVCFIVLIRLGKNNVRYQTSSNAPDIKQLRVVAGAVLALVIVLFALDYASTRFADQTGASTPRELHASQAMQFAAQ